MSYLASELSETVKILKNTAGNGISAKFKISNCQRQKLADVKFQFIYLFYGMFISFILIFLYVSLSSFLMWGAANLCISSLKWHLGEIVYDKEISLYDYCCSRSCLFTEWNLLNNSADWQNNQPTLTGLLLAIITHLASLQSLLIKLNPSKH